MIITNDYRLFPDPKSLKFSNVLFGYCGIGNYRMLLWYTCKNCVYKRGSRPVSRHRHLTIVLQWETGRALWRIGLQLPLVYSHFLSCIKPFWLQGVPLFAVYVDCWLLCGVLSGWNVAHEKVASLIDVQVVKLRPGWGWSLVKLNGELRMAARRWSTEVHKLLYICLGCDWTL